MTPDFAINAFAIGIAFAATVFAIVTLARKNRVSPVPRRTLVALVVVGMVVTVVGVTVLFVNSGAQGSFNPRRYEDSVAQAHTDSLKQLERRQQSLDTMTAGINLATTGRLRGAIGLYQHAIAIDSTNAEAHGYLGYALYKLRSYDQALAATHKAQQLDPRSPWHAYNEAVILWAQHDTTRAIQSLCRVIAIDSTFASVMWNDEQFETMKAMPAFRAIARAPNPGAAAPLLRGIAGSTTPCAD